MKLALASIFTLGILFTFLLAIIAGALYSLGIIEIWFVIVLTGIIFFLQWLLSPYISDIIYRWLYRLKWIGIEGLEEKDKKVADFVKEICRKNKIKVPKIGFIDDDNPQAFTYGSAAFNARLVFTEGIFTYLDTEERKAVFAHEIGHIVHRDFIIMTFAAFIISMLYHISQVLIRARSREKEAGYAKIIGFVAYIFYFIGTYILLFLSRIREYYADEFSVKATNNSDALAQALIKVAYGIIARPEEKKQTELMQGTRTLGIMDFKAAKGIGLTYLACLKLKSWEPIQKAFLFDLKNPWAFIYELNSSHPLVAKRIKRIEKIKDVKAFDFDKIEKYPIDKKKLYTNFFKDIFFEFLPLFPFVLFPTFILLVLFNVITLPFSIIHLLGMFFVGLGLSIIAKTFYRYTSATHKKSNILDLMGDVYASPIRGIPVELEGVIVGRGIPGLILSEDMMLQDKTGITYLNYEGLVPFFSNLIFAIFKLERLVGKECKVFGWFIRGLSPRIELKSILVEGKEIKSWIRFWGILIGIFIILVGIAFSFLFSSFISFL
jgi:Zn-dependent protease with chaperone function